MVGAVRGALVRSEFSPDGLQKETLSAYLTTAVGTVVVGVVRMLYDPAGSGSTPPGVQLLQGGECSGNSALS